MMNKHLEYPLTHDEMIEPDKLHPIIMSQPMMKANLSGLKEVTRRTSGLAKINEEPEKWTFVEMKNGHALFFAPNNPEKPFLEGTWAEIKCPYGKIGHYLWVRENWTQNGLGYYRYQVDWKKGEGPFTGPSVPDKFRNKWKPSIHMPRVASRMTLEVTGIRIERLEQISAKEIVREGLRLACAVINPENTLLILFQNLWNKLHGKGKNVWEKDKKKFVWVIDYKIVKPKP